MHTFTRILAPALVASLALSAAIPAQARPSYDHSTPARAEAIRHQIEELQQRVARNDRRDRISEREAAGLRNDVRRLRDQFRTYNRNGLSDSEFRTLERRIKAIRDRLHDERRDRDHHRM